MTDQTQEKPITIAAKISLPDVWTVRHYSIYQDGQRRYNAPILEAKGIPLPINSRYYGCMALVDAGIVKIPPELKTMLEAKQFDDLPVGLIANVNRLIGYALEAEFDKDFLG